MKTKKKRPQSAVQMDQLIIEMKKKIQLSEGQRKALFEEYEREQRKNGEKIEILKTEVSRLIITLRNKTSTSAKDRLKITKLDSLADYLGEKTTGEVIEVLDLQRIDKVKKLDLIRYRIQQIEKLVKDLQVEHQTLNSKEVKKKFIKKIDKPISKSTFSLENEIHSVQVQWREANHVKNRYNDIKKTLGTEASTFNGIVKKFEQQLKNQQIEIEKLQKVCIEASRMKASIRTELLLEETTSMQNAIERERLIEDGRRMVEEGREELERIEKQMFLMRKPIEKQEEEIIREEAGPNDEIGTPSPNPEEELIETFNKLSEIVGAKNAGETWEKFQSQKETFAKLESLKIKTEEQKERQEEQIQNIVIQLENSKFAEIKDAEQNVEQAETLRSGIEEHNKRKHINMEKHQEITSIITKISSNLHKMYLNIEPKSSDTKKVDEILILIRTTLTPVLNEEEQPLQLAIEEIDEKWFPPSYNPLLRRTPIVQQNIPATVVSQTQMSEEEDDCPSRDFLKKQSQILVDAKSRKKVMRFSQNR